MNASTSSSQRDFVGYGPCPPDPQWPGGARLALNLVINYEEGSEPSVPDGDPESESGLTEGGAGGFSGRDLGAESMFEYGSRVGIWRVLRILQERKLPATFFACAVALERNPAVAKAIRDGDYDVCSHGRRWERHQTFSAEQEAREIRAAIGSIERTTGQHPAGWYCRYAPTQHTRRLLLETGGFLYDSDAYNDELPYWVRIADHPPHLVIPYSLATNDGKFARGSIATATQFFEYLRDTFDVLHAEGAASPKMMSVGMHMRLIGHPGRAVALARFLDYIKTYPDVWICRRIDIAKHWHERHPA